MDGKVRAEEALGTRLEVVCRREAPDAETLAYVRRKVAAAAGDVEVMFGRVTLTHEPHRSIARPDVVDVSLDVNGHLVRAHAVGRTTREAADIMEERLARELGDLHDRVASTRRRHSKHTLRSLSS
jgi:ribosome-associated translation inhibitor RaiA